ncbi:MAG: NAAT family transporter [Ectothiorhodospiraceae bacterium]|nr:NAAT family transporter [Ectothiorhodospiraceae bacterium]
MQFGLLFEYWLITMSALFVIVNPLTTAFAFLSLMARASEATREAVARRATLIATGIFVVFALLGGVIFKLFGITLEAFRIAGGLILFGIAMGMIRRGQDEGEEVAGEDPRGNGKLAQDVSVIPLAIPFISGPGSIATVMILTSQAPTAWHLILVFMAIGLTTGACYFAMVYSRYLVRLLGETGKEIVTRLFGIILSVIAVQFVINGVLDIYRGL